MSKLEEHNTKRTLGNLKTAMDVAVGHLTKLMYSKNKAVSRAACSDLLRHGLKAYELYEIEERLRYLEENMEKQNNERVENERYGK